MKIPNVHFQESGGAGGAGPKRARPARAREFRRKVRSVNVIRGRV